MNIISDIYAKPNNINIIGKYIHHILICIFFYFIIAVYK